MRSRFLAVGKEHMQFFKKVVPYTTKEGEKKQATRLFIRRNEHSYPIEIEPKFHHKRDWWELVDIGEDIK